MAPKEAKGGNGQGTLVYDAALAELELLVDDAKHRDAIESTVINESRGHDVWALHTSLTAIQSAYEDLAKTLEVVRDEVDAHASDTQNALSDEAKQIQGVVADLQERVTADISEFREVVEASFERSDKATADGIEATQDEIQATQEQIQATQDQIEAGLSQTQAQAKEGFSNTVDELKAGFEASSDQVDAGFEATQGVVDDRIQALTSVLEESFSETQDLLNGGFEGAEARLGNQVGSLEETVSENFEVTNERTATELGELRDEMTKVLDKRFNHIDQTFASLRADFEVLKALQMELIKERVGRPELVRQQQG